MRVELLVFEGCPHADAARLMLGRVIDELGIDLEVTERVGDYASPTVLVNGVDVMTGQAEVPARPACRLDVPTEVAVRTALETAISAGDTPTYPPELAVGVTSSRIARVSASGRYLHRAILRSFATTGSTPGPADLIAATPDGHDPRSLLDELHAQDVVRLDIDGAIRAAYPFSGVPTPHRVAIAGGPTVYSMCAIDALGIHDMLDQDTLITSADPHTGEAISVTVRDGLTVWSPAATVVFVGANGDAVPSDGASEGPVSAAADRCCGVMNFFANRGTAEAWLADHPQTSGHLLTQRQAMQLGIDIFGDLLDE